MPDTPPDLSEIARQLRQPTGELGREVARRMNESNRVQNREAERLLELGTAHKLLELGMGNGGLVTGLLERWPELTYYGVDFSTDMVEEASQLNAPAVQAGKAHFVYGTTTVIPYNDQLFDRILTVNTLYFWPDPAEGLQELYRMLEPGGLLVLAIRSEESMRHFAFVNEIFTLYNRDSLQALFADSPFHQVEIHSFHEEMRISASGQVGPAESLIAVARR